MSYRKFRADHLFTGHEWFPNDYVLITSDAGEVVEIVPAAEAGEDIQIFSGILTPGFLNCHCHLELSHMKGLIPEKTGLVDFVFKIVSERHHSEDEIFAAIENAENEMLENGIVAIGDICNNSLTIFQKQKQRLYYYNLIEASGWLPSASQMRLERAKNLFHEFSILNAQCSIVPHAPYSVSENLWKEIQPYFKNRVVTIHNQETAFEDEFFLKGSGDLIRMYELMKIDNTHYRPTKKTSLQSYFSNLSGAEKAILVHNTFTAHNDVNYIKLQTLNFKPQTFICLCVNANTYIEGVLPPVEMFRKNECTMVLGTDSLASNWSLNILDEIKTIRNNFPLIPFEEMLRWATSNGAKALMIDDVLGSFEKGKKPGIILINPQNLSAERLI